MIHTEKLSYEIINRAFSKQAVHYDADDAANPILTSWRQQVYSHVNKFLSPSSFILELNAGTGIDAVHFAKQGHRVHAIDIAQGMLAQLQKKSAGLSLTCERLSFEELHFLSVDSVDYVFSNFGGLNCTDDLSKVARYLPFIVKRGGYVTFVIMPPVSLWEWLWLFKGHGKKAFRRLNKDGVMAHLEGEYFQTYYHAVNDIKKGVGDRFKLIACEGLGIFSPPPSKPDFVSKHPMMYKILTALDKSLRNLFPFNRWADHTIVTFQYLG
ncbi:MAG TPA: methyltransferase domain-containing protein [Cyclobacteriaceae bacterium]|nr:methyltransferase domain-containing protein [Cyclobacteriaceae bacterium]